MDNYPVNFMTDVGRVRKYIPDLMPLPDPAEPTSTPTFMWSDDALQSFIDDEWTDYAGTGKAPRQAILRAAANAMIATANNENLILKKIVTEDLQTDGPSVAKAMIAAASELYKKAAEIEIAEAQEELFFSVPYVHTPPRFDWR